MSAIILSNPGQKSELRKMYDSVMSHTGLAKHHVAESAKSIRAGGESALVGGLLGAAHASLPHGLDYEVPGGKGMVVPIDGLVAVGGLIGAAVLGQGDDYSADVRNAGAAAAAVLAFRKTASYVQTRRALAGLPTGGAVPAARMAGESSIGEDPIVRTARMMANR